MEVSTFWFKLCNVSPVKLKYIENCRYVLAYPVYYGTTNICLCLCVYLSIYLFFVCIIALIFQHLSQMGLGVVELHIQVSEGLMICFILRFKFLTSIFLKEYTESTGINWK